MNSERWLSQSSLPIVQSRGGATGAPLKPHRLDGHPVRPQARQFIRGAAPVDELWQRDNLLVAPARLAEGQSLADTPRASAGKARGGPPH